MPAFWMRRTPRASPGSARPWYKYRTGENGNLAIVSVEVQTERGIYAGVGDASPASVARPMIPHLIRLAETRAKAGALRDAVNVAVAALEELGGTAEERETPIYGQRAG